MTFQSDTLAVRRALVELCQSLAGYGLVQDDIGAVEITLSEALNNIVEHAYPDGQLGDIALTCDIQNAEFNVQILDRGAAMPGLSPPIGAAKPEICDFDDMPEGGFGWFLIRELTTELDYRRVDGENRLSLTVPIASPVRASA